MSAATSTRVSSALNSFKIDVVELDVKILGTQIMRLIKDVGQLNIVSSGDLKVKGKDDQTAPTDLKEAMRWGTKFFDAVYYFALESGARPAHTVGTDCSSTLENDVLLTKKRLLWTAIFLMLRGSYPESATKVIGKDVPAFLSKICEMDESPLECANGLASFNLKSINPGWIREIQWGQFAPPIKQRLGLGLAGYRALAPFKLYSCRDDVHDDVKAAFKWVVNVAGKDYDYGILSCTRDAGLISKLGSWNAALGNLSLLCFTDEQLREMEMNKIIFKLPVRDPRADTWKIWVQSGDLVLSDPIGLN